MQPLGPRPPRNIFQVGQREPSTDHYADPSRGLTQQFGDALRAAEAVRRPAGGQQCAGTGRDHCLQGLFQISGFVEGAMKGGVHGLG